MTLTQDEAITRGAQFVRDHMTIVSAAFPPEIAAAYAGGIATGIRNWVMDTHDRRAAYDLFQGLADLVLTETMTEGQR